MWARIASELHFSFDINSIEAKNTNYVQYHFEILKGFLVEGYLLGAKYYYKQCSIRQGCIYSTQS